MSPRLSLSAAAARCMLAVVAVRRCSALAWILVVLAIALGCRKVPAEIAPDVPVVTDASTGLLLTWIDDKGEFHVEESVGKVPEGARQMVRVADPNKDPPSGDRIFVADLRVAGPGGTYPVRIAPRAELEDLVVARRKAHGSVLATAPPASAPGAGSAAGAGPAGEEARPPVIIYGASWCGPCHQAAAYLKKRGVRFVEHDIERDSVAAREMQAKLAKAGRHGGSIPVIDVRGTILVGFDASAVERALGATL